MFQPTASLILLGLLGATSLVTAQQYDQETQHRDASCNNGCYFEFFTNKCSGEENADCRCSQPDHREGHLCCVARKCAPYVVTDALERYHNECNTRNMPFTFDIEAVCGVTFVTVSPSASSAAAAATTTSSAPSTVSSEASSTTGAAESASTSASGAGSSQTGAESSPTPTPNGAPGGRGGMGGLAVALGAAVVMLR